MSLTIPIMMILYKYIENVTVINNSSVELPLCSFYTFLLDIENIIYIKNIQIEIKYIFKK